MIEHVGRFNARYGGQEGWKLSGRFASGLRQLADMVDGWRSDRQDGQKEREELLLGML
jgi:hypothetical protein